MREVIRDICLILIAGALALVEVHWWDREWKEWALHLLCTANLAVMSVVYFTLKIWRRS